ncbi:hypothetical protein [Sphingobium agri]|uniref:DUF2285 domain-containing protein n=1 Tax=Sphingobium agri TaxID=2933566 RepID=A0ABT0E215_9SPHN|nr:hypothetical protein [Sphingobium agri]MCK0533411.1 hypothetical protein [Sphingobium agri]
MANLLTEPRSTMPAAIVAGDSLRVDRADLAATYPAADGYTASFVFVPVAGGDPVSIEATGGASAWSLLLPADTTEAWGAGDWRWAVKIAKGADRATAESGQLRVNPDPAANIDTRSHARKVLAKIEAAIEGRASQTDLEYTFADGRQIKRMAHRELTELRSYYAKLVAGEDRKAGRSGPGRVLVSL